MSHLLLPVKKTFLFFSLFCLSNVQLLAQDIPSPQQYLGYVLGSRFTPHDKIVAYFQQVARSAPDRMLLKEYGRTYEGRPLLLAFIASPENLKRLDAIRLNNLRLAGVLKDGVAADENAPVIVWLSYNVHGNEPSSSEAAMKTMYELVSGGAGATTGVNSGSSAASGGPTVADEANTMGGGPATWLKNTIVVIDPCINPDGRDRYVNWYNSVVGVQPNPSPQAREHREPWPHGRANHYNFDLNRDWAWQTQVETQARLKQYNDIYVEPAFSTATEDSLKVMGYQVARRGSIGRTEVIKVYPGPVRRIVAVGDHRGDDTALGY